MPFRMTTLMKFSNPDVMYMINDKTKTYAEMDLAKMRDQASKMRGEKAKETWTVKKLGKGDRERGYSCEHVLLGHTATTRRVEYGCLWTSRRTSRASATSPCGDWDEAGEAQERRGHDEGPPADAGADGFVVKMVHCGRRATRRRCATM